MIRNFKVLFLFTGTVTTSLNSCLNFSRKYGANLPTCQLIMCPVYYINKVADQGHQNEYTRWCHVELGMINDVEDTNAIDQVGSVRRALDPRHQPPAPKRRQNQG